MYGCLQALPLGRLLVLRTPQVLDRRTARVRFAAGQVGHGAVRDWGAGRRVSAEVPRRTFVRKFASGERDGASMGGRPDPATEQLVRGVWTRDGMPSEPYYQARVRLEHVSENSRRIAYQRQKKRPQISIAREQL